MRHRDRPGRACPSDLAIRVAIALLLAAAGAPATLSAHPPGSAPLAQHAHGADDHPAPIAPPDLAAPVATLLKASYLTDEERRDLRIFHGVWTAEDLDTPARRARTALIRLSLDDPALADPAAPAEDRAEAMRLRGELAEAIDTLRDADSMRAHRLRAEALEGLGRFDAAADALRPLLTRLGTERLTTAEDAVEGVRGLMVLERLGGPEQGLGGAQDYHAMMALLAGARDAIDRLYWPAALAEAHLLYEKDNRSQAEEAARQVLSLNPSCAEAWALLGQLAVDSFNFEVAAQIAARLDELAAPGAPSAESEHASPHGAIILAKARLRQRDADGAAELLRPLVARFPRMRPLLAAQAAAAAGRFDFDQTEQLLSAFNALSPGSADALLEVGRTLSEARQYDRASDYLQRAAARSPNRPEPFIELGLMELQAARDAESLAALRRAVELDPFNVRADNTLRMVERLATFARAESEHFIVRYQPGIDEVLAPEMLAPLEANYRRVTGAERGGIDHEPPFKAVIDLMPDHQSFAVRIAGVTDIHTMAAATGPAVAMESPREGPGHKVGTYDWVRVVRHEFAHTVTLSRTNNRIPHWFTEAAAVYLEDAPRDYPACELLSRALRAGTLFDFNEINLAFVRPKKPTDRSQAYAQGHWMYEFMIEAWGDRAPLDLMDLYAQGINEEAAVRQVLGLPRAEFMERFKAWAGDQVVAWGMAPPEGAPTLRELLRSEASVAEHTSPVPPDEVAPPEPATPADDAIGPVLLPPPEGDNEATDPKLPLSPPDEARPDEDPPNEALIARWLELYPRHPDVLRLALAAALEKTGGRPTPDLVPLLDRYAAARPVDPLPHKLLTRLHLDGRAAEAGLDPAGVIPHLEFLDARESYSPVYAAELARRYAALGDRPRASAKAERATQIAPFDADYRELAATVALQSQDLATAERHLLALTKIEPDRDRHRQRLEALQKRRGAE